MKIIYVAFFMVALSSYVQAETIGDVTYTPEELHAEYKKNELRADNKFSCQFIIKGKVKEIYRRSLSDNDYQIRLQGNVNINFDKLNKKSDTAKDIADLNIGELVYVSTSSAYLSWGSVFGKNGFWVSKHLDESANLKSTDGVCLKEIKLGEKYSENEKLSNSNSGSLSQSEKEKTIVTSYAMADKKLNEVWQSLAKAKRNELLQEQRNWIKEKEKCATIECKVEMTTDRIVVLEKISF
ncbi:MULTISPECIES: lysozyme inhibitor LprI family protein [unclassified Symbiopectobacterium]|uniref:lysozyme inhibitor LprI family protein n=1 Tax=unclassified Symbiopectobacterium TaxID=2794573 RepID=UPI002227E8CE|nr:MULTISPECIES: lysozyme inhibitor LprI family protein [unclassified Symbiopectobacterium]MCW2475922.1 DUF1311 domain-containing protein [Candidatus Symbiopectobacterium sp. NZEC151]MCW2481963.1 DUF1311 domain-containing protein [Candidatus Symbiopectobacterium sp. NZEC135]